MEAAQEDSEVSQRVNLLYPCDAFDRRAPDAEFADEIAAASKSGLSYSLIDLSELGNGTVRLFPRPAAAAKVLYRGWMLDLQDYERMHEALLSVATVPVISPAMYGRCHHLPGWFEQCEEFTAPTLCVDRHANFAKAVEGLNWPAYFVKDYVKSFGGSRGSVANHPDQISEIVDLIEHYRGRIEGGVCIRRFEHLQPESEERYFVVAGRPHARIGPVPEWVATIAARIDSPFYSVDVAHDADGRHRLIEIGDGQVSDRKHWPLERFVALFDEL